MTADAIHICYNNQNIVLRLMQQDICVRENIIAIDEKELGLERFLRLYAHEEAPIFVFIDDRKVMFSDITVAITFSDEDVLQYILLEQARLFPLLDEKIYVDFFLKDTQQNEKIFTVAACNSHDFIWIEILIKTLKLHFKYLGIEKFPALNLLPWRQGEKQAILRSRRKIFAFISISTSLIMLLISLFFIKIARDDRLIEQSISTCVSDVILHLQHLENLNKSYGVLSRIWQQYIENAREQLRLENLLLIIESKRPENFVLDSIQWQENYLLLQGRAKESGAVREYLDDLNRYQINGKIKLMSSVKDKKFYYHFEIVSGLKKS